MRKQIQEAKPTEADVLADLLAHGSPTYEHAQESGTGRPVEADYAGTGHDRMMADTISAANHNDGKDEKSSTPNR